MTVIQIPLKEKAKPRVQDERGDIFELERLASGGQGIVCKTQYPHILVKLCKKDMPEKRPLLGYTRPGQVPSSAVKIADQYPKPTGPRAVRIAHLRVHPPKNAAPETLATEPQA